MVRPGQAPALAPAAGVRAASSAIRSPDVTGRSSCPELIAMPPCPLSTSMLHRGCLAEWARGQQKIAIPGHGCPGAVMAESPERDLCHKDTRQDNALAVEVADDPDCVPSDQCAGDDPRGRDTEPDRLFRRGGAQAVPALRRGRARRD